MQRLTSKTGPGTKGFSRRAFLKGAGVTGGMIALGDQLLIMRAAAAKSTEQIRIGICGLGERGYLLLQTFLKVPGVEVASICDVDPRAVRAAYSSITREQSEPEVVTDFRRMLDDRSIDAIVIATPDHWHALMGIKACEAGKSCYIENPCSYTFAEGRQLVAAAQKHQCIVQYGSLGKLTDVSGVDPVELACLGKIHSTRTTIYAAGPPTTTHNFGFFTLDDLHRNIRMLGSAFPSRVSTLAAGRTPSASRTAVQMEFVNETTERARRLDLEVIPISALPPDLAAAIEKSSVRRKQYDLVSETTIIGSNGRLTTTATQNRTLETEYLVQNFILAIRERNKQLLASPIGEAHVSCGSLHLANISGCLKRPINFDPASQSAPDDLQVQQLLSRATTLKL